MVGGDIIPGSRGSGEPPPKRSKLVRESRGASRTIGISLAIVIFVALCWWVGNALSDWFAR